MSEVELYNAPQSTCSQRVRYVLNAKGIAFDEHQLDLFSGDQLKPEYLSLNPNGVVPTLIHDGKIIIDSAVITEYLDEVFSYPSPLVPNDPAARATMRSMMRFIDEVPTPAIRCSARSGPLPACRPCPCRCSQANTACRSASSLSAPLKPTTACCARQAGFCAGSTIHCPMRRHPNDH